MSFTHIPDANATVNGQITTANQSFAGIKTFSDGIKISGTTLTEFEEGTFTPVLAAASGSGVAYTTQTGHYMRVHNWVFGIGRLTLSSKGTASGGLRIAGLPYTVRASFWSPIVIGFFRNLSSNVVSLGGYCNPGTTDAILQRLLAAGTGTDQLLATEISNTFDIIFNFQYQVN